jgi:hypothetical protein
MYAETPPVLTLAGSYLATSYPELVADGKVYVPDNAVNTYKAAIGWSSIADKIVSINTLDASDYPENWQEEE